MNELRVILNEKRKKRGSVNFDFPETKIILDENGKVTDIKPYERNLATNLIEEFMLVCNETVARIIIGKVFLLFSETMNVPMRKK